MSSPADKEPAAPLAPLVVAFMDDLFLEPKLQDATRGLGFELRLIDRPEQIAPPGEQPGRAVPLTEPLHGPDAAFIRWLATLQPGLLLFDLSSRTLPWEHWIQILKTSAATQRVPVVAFGPHVEAGSLERARRAGADEVVTRGQLQNGLAGILEKRVRRPDREALSAACLGTLSELTLRGIRLHNAGQYFEAHEDLEHAWMEADEVEGTLYRALLQVTVAHLHLERRNLAGAVKMLMRLHQWLDSLPDRCRGIDVLQLRADVDRLRTELYHWLDSGSTPPAGFQAFPFPIPLQGLEVE